MGRSTEGFNAKLVFAIVAGALGSSFQHGYNTGVLNNPQKVIQEWITTTLENRTGEVPMHTEITMIWSIAVSIFCIGGMIGGVLTGFVADTFGRKGGLLVNNILVLAASILQGSARAASCYELIIAGRFLIGVNSGLNAGLAPMYLAEISPVKLRGAVGTVYQLIITISILVAQILGLRECLGTETRWPTLLAVIIVPAMFQMVTLPFCPESPKHLFIGKGKEIESRNAILWLRNGDSVHDEMEELRAEYEAMKISPKVTMRELLSNSALRIPLIICVVLMIAQQLSGINAVMFFSTEIFMSTGMREETASYATLGMGCINVLMTIVSLVLVEKAGRKSLLLVGFIGMTIDTLILTVALSFASDAQWVSYLSIILVLIFVIMFATGPGSIPWFMVSELFNQSARPAATSLAVAVNWTTNFLVGLGFLPLKEIMGANVFIIFTVILALNVIFIYKKVPETKNKTIEEISAMFRQQSYE